MLVNGPRPRLGSTFAGWFLAAAALYLLTGAQGLAWGDPSKLTLYAIAGYLQDPGSVGNRAAIEFYSGTSCDENQYASPAVALDYLPANAQPIIDAMDAIVPSGYTNTYAALEGLTMFTAANQTPGRIIIGRRKVSPFRHPNLQAYLV